MVNGQPIFMSIILAAIGLYILLDQKRLTRRFIETKERHVVGRKLSDFEKAYARFGVLAGGLFGLGIGIYLTIKTLMGQ